MPSCQPPLGVYRPHKLEQIQVREVNVCSGDGKVNTGIVLVGKQFKEYTSDVPVVF